MTLTPLPHSETRHRYLRCANEHSEQYTCVLFPANLAQMDYLQSVFTEVVDTDATLPAWRLYQITE